MIGLYPLKWLLSVKNYSKPNVSKLKQEVSLDHNGHQQQTALTIMSIFTFVFNYKLLWWVQCYQDTQNQWPEQWKWCPNCYKLQFDIKPNIKPYNLNDKLPAPKYKFQTEDAIGFKPNINISPNQAFKDILKQHWPCSISSIRSMCNKYFLIFNFRCYRNSG